MTVYGFSQTKAALLDAMWLIHYLRSCVRCEHLHHAAEHRHGHAEVCLAVQDIDKKIKALDDIAMKGSA